MVKHVITGGPCTGKTTTVEALEKRGFNVIKEASRILIDEQVKSGGDLVPWKRLHEFNIKVTQIQQELEAKAGEGTHFVDRGIIDNLAYCEWGKIEPPEQLVRAVEKVSYGKIFLLKQLPHYEKDTVRKESKEDQARLHSLIRKHYQERGYEVIEVPPKSVEERAEFIVSKIQS